MQEFINHIASKAGISADQATMAANAVVEFLKGKTPEGVAHQIQNVFAGQPFNMGSLLKEEASDKLSDAKDAIADKFEDLKDGAKDLLGKVGL
ncbi:MAG: hypothetical protein H7Y04_08600 [Verrucomicrobia bacterium]|nr:hypothetical protein [Cytophagales bacterium]